MDRRVETRRVRSWPPLSYSTSTLAKVPSLPTALLRHLCRSDTEGEQLSTTSAWPATQQPDVLPPSFELEWSNFMSPGQREAYRKQRKKQQKQKSSMEDASMIAAVAPVRRGLMRNLIGIEDFQIPCEDQVQGRVLRAKRPAPLPPTGVQPFRTKRSGDSVVPSDNWKKDIHTEAVSFHADTLERKKEQEEVDAASSSLIAGEENTTEVCDDMLLDLTGSLSLSTPSFDAYSSEEDCFCDCTDRKFESVLSGDDSNTAFSSFVDWSVLPQNLLCHIFSVCDASTQRCFGQVCQSWRAATQWVKGNSHDTIEATMSLSVVPLSKGELEAYTTRICDVPLNQSAALPTLSRRSRASSLVLGLARTLEQGSSVVASSPSSPPPNLSVSDDFPTISRRRNLTIGTRAAEGDSPRTHRSTATTIVLKRSGSSIRDSPGRELLDPCMYVPSSATDTRDTRMIGNISNAGKYKSPVPRIILSKRMNLRKPRGDEAISKSNSAPDYGSNVYSVLMLGGESGVGTTSLIRCLTKKDVKKDHTPTLDESNVELRLWDTSGHSDFECVHREWSDRNEGIVFLYSCASILSFSEMQLRMATLDVERRRIPHVIVGTKRDISHKKRQVEFVVAARFAESFNCPFFETSAIEDFNVTAPFVHIVRIIRNWRRSRSIDAIVLK